MARSGAKSKSIHHQAKHWRAISALQAEVEQKEAKLQALRSSSAERLANIEGEKTVVASKVAEALQ